MIRTVVIDVPGISRDLTVTALSNENDIYVVGTAVDLQTAKTILSCCDVVLIRARVPDEKSLRLVNGLHQAGENVKLLVYDLMESEAAALAFIEAGAHGYVFEGGSYVDLVRMIIAIAENQAHVSAQMAAKLMMRIQQLKELSLQLEHVYQYQQRYKLLTDREKEVLHLIGQGLSNRAIAETLYVEPGTVKNHVHNILKKLDVHNRQDAALFLALQQETYALVH